MGRTKFSTYAYVLFLIIVIGTFSSIAQNEYGVKLIAFGCFCFSLIIIWRLYSILTTEKPLFRRSELTMEYIAMSGIMALFGLRALRIKFASVEVLFVVLALVLCILYVMYFMKLYQIYKSSKPLTITISFLYASVVLFFLSLSFTFLDETISTFIGACSFLSALIFLAWYYRVGKEVIFQEDRVNIFDSIFQYLNLSPVILSIIMLISLYMGLFKVNILPPIYTGEVPVRYLEMTENQGDINISDGSKSETYWGAYQEFLKFMEERKEK